LRELLKVPDTHAVLFTQGGGTTQFSSVVLNLLAYNRIKNKDVPAEQYQPPTVDYIVTGSWSSKAAAEAKRLVLPSKLGEETLAKVHVAATTKPTGFNRVPRKEEYNFTPGAAYVYYCENETINGVQFAGDAASPAAVPFDLIPEDVPIVADYSSSFISRPIPNIERHALIYAGAQKNLGPAGVVVVIVRKDLLVDTNTAVLLGGVPVCPIELEYKILADNGSLYNTPPVFSIYVSALVLNYLVEEKGGIAGVKATNEKKAQLLYAALEEVEKKGLVRLTVTDREARSWMNVTWVIDEADGDAEGSREKRFLKGAEEQGFRQIKGHRSVGGESFCFSVSSSYAGLNPVFL
jgi:phosphoserine aminotransferase